ncbi:MAG: hypothetical protein FWD34_07735 [Oscillospiraceae bacterium]|nr:hypothetical protein [Oscillospiraceae bacterium]
MKKPRCLLIVLIIPLFLITACVAEYNTFSPMEDNELSLSTDIPIIIKRDINNYSTEGGYLQAVTVNNEIQYLYVQIFGEMFQCSYSYFFNSDNIILLTVRENYVQPFYIDSSIHIKNIERQHYMFVNEALFEITNEYDTLNELDSQKYQEMSALMNSFIEEVNAAL